MPHSNLVYKSKCNICNDIYEHLDITPLTEKKVKVPKESAAFDHIFRTGHNASFYNFETLVKEPDEFRLLLRESLLI